MAETLKGPSIYNPKTLTELLNIMAKDPKAVLLAGGTDIMRKEGFYPDPDKPDLINLSGVTELSRVFHSEKFLEVGSMVTISQLMTTGSYILSNPMYEALENLASSIIRNQATIGGALCSVSSRSSLSCYLSAIGTQAEVKIASQKGKNRYSVQTRWVTLNKLYNPDGSLTLPPCSLITKIRIPAFEQETQVFRSIGSINRNPSESLSFALCFSLLQRKIISPTLVISFAKGGFFTSDVIEEALGSISLPVVSKDIIELTALFSTELKSVCPNISELQEERARRLFESVLYNSNNSYLAG